MTHDDQVASAREALFDALHAILAAGGVAELRAFIASNPASRSELIDYASEFMAAAPYVDDDPGSGTDVGDAVPTPATGDALSRYLEGRPRSSGDIFAGLGAGDLDRIAEHCLIDSDILRQLARRRVDAGSVPGRLVAMLAEAMGQASATVFAHLADDAEVLAADRFAPSGLTHGGKVSFAEAVRTSSLDNGLKRFWLAKVGG